MTTPAAQQAPPSGHTVDGFLDGLVTLVQPRGGHRAGLDAALLQALVPPDASGQAYEFGSGVGTIAFSVAARAPGLVATGIERDPELVACGRLALQQPGNRGFAERVWLVEGDVSDWRNLRDALGLAESSAGWVLMNPPFDVAGAGTSSPDRARRAAHVGEASLLDAWVNSAAHLLKPRGMLGVVHRAHALADLLRALGTQFGDIRVLPVHPSPSTAASRVVIRATRGSRALLQIRPGLALHRSDGGWTDAAEAILRGRSALPI